MLSLEDAQPLVRTDRPGYRPWRARVSAVTPLSPHFTRVTFRDEELKFFGTDLLDQRIKVIFPFPGRPLFELPDTEGNAWWDFWRDLPAEDQAPFRTYTVRDVRPTLGEVDVDFVVHSVPAGAELGPAGRWLLEASAGDEVYLVGPDARSIHSAIGIDWHPGDATRLLLAGDETALPAIAGILSALPADAIGDALIEVPSSGDIISLTHPAGVNVRILPREDAEHGAALTAAVDEWLAGHGELLEAARAPRGQKLNEVNLDTEILWETPTDEDSGEFYAWLAGESGVIKQLRRTLVQGHGVDRRRVAFMGYWRIGKAEN
ncbi:siderophore-interacting protein [Mycetocola tolaasinivorans]|uniref:Siderophore-interacting protein n=1 Tax=Mycetocola tolaasinivorans TaxID=76635 RepID=A0A3L7A5M0_9MICO|nr:siderophore-interacting protein [Mycetocola tolaasinivorans]RLP75335.1 siderophore-interacting protein [Mycetocola tolaasinivorans]